MRILGISCYFHDASAALLEDGALIAAAEEERFTRIKHDYDFPSNAIQFCLDTAGIDAGDIDYVVFFEKPFIKFERLLKSSLSAYPRSYRSFVQSMRTWLFDKLWIKSRIQTELNVTSDQILFSDHHMSHAASAYFSSPFEESAVVTFDGVGEWATATTGYGKGTDLKIENELWFPHSIGLLYSAFTAFLGFEVNEGEYKVMGMAPYGQPKYVEDIERVVRQYPDGSIWLDSKYFSFHHSISVPFTKHFLKLFGEQRDPEVPFFTQDSGYPSYYDSQIDRSIELMEYNQRYADLAASLQVVVENIIINIVKAVHRKTGSTNLCMAGGVALNSMANTRILQETPIEQLYIQPAAGDGGGSLGAALYAWHTEFGGKERFVMDHAYWGQGYGDASVGDALTEANLKSVEFDDRDKLIAETVDRIKAGKVIGWFQGRFEFGPRALGNRSILADPRSAEMKDVVNTKIKFREPFRPFAPSVLQESVSDYFEMPAKGSGYPERFMLLVVPVKSAVESSIPAVSHQGTSRIQAVHSESSGMYHQLISGFYGETGVPLLLNTSFNVRGEPVVNSPKDAIRTFTNSGIDSLVIGNQIVDKVD